ncbi:hypothetical protein APHCRT_1215 [Anaplasma phagocytophilum str. CRT53-1]|uniref:Uncharacterized protein n=1 Tax=Anaplasma phagocytophilum str. CRT53-1 TaxID=1359157 RepID=A0A0F3PXQ5_ANAPH|nr:hypothetical protein APHCRT_1215 [Anaplasma phagocytophilum str. CRT53-1]
MRREFANIRRVTRQVLLYAESRKKISVTFLTTWCNFLQKVAMCDIMKSRV